MRKKISDTNTVVPEVTNKVYEDRLSIIHGLGKPIPDYFIEEIRLDVKEWSEKPTSLRFKDYLRERRIPWKVFCDMKDRYAPLQQEYEWALDAIASRREIGVSRFDLHPAALRMMPRYDDEWTENEKKLEEIKKIGQPTETGNVRVVYYELPAIPNSPLVPELKEDND